MRNVLINDDYRITLTEATDTSFEWVLGDDVGLVWLNSSGSKEYVPYNKTSEYYACNFIADGDYSTWKRKTSRLDAYAKYISVSEEAQGMSAKRISLQGYSQSDWAEAIVYGVFTEEQFEEVIQNVRLWWQGDVYSVYVQKRKLFTSTDGEIIERWDTIPETGYSARLIEYGVLLDTIAKEVWDEFKEGN